MLNEKIIFVYLLDSLVIMKKLYKLSTTEKYTEEYFFNKKFENY